MSDDILRPDGTPTGFKRVAATSVPRDGTRCDLTDAQRRDFLRQLDASQKVTLYDFELNFTESNLNRGQFSPKQQAVIDDMVEKYAARIGW